MEQSWVHMFEFICIFSVLVLFRFVAMFLTKKVNFTFAFFDSWAYTLMFILPALLPTGFDPPMEALVSLLSAIVFPIIYISLKKRAFADNGLYVGFYYPLIEFSVLALSALTLIVAARLSDL